MIAVKPLPRVRTDPSIITLRGGWDQVTPSLALPPGVLRDVENFEVHHTGLGYTRIGGYERFDGRPRPSDAVATLIQVTAFTNVPAAGDTLTGATSGATAVVIFVNTNDRYLVVTKTTGAFSSNEEVRVGATVIGQTTALTVTPTAKELATYRNLAADEYRRDIQGVPGSGPVRGVAGLVVNGADQVFAFRDNAAGTAVEVYKATSTGWTQVTLFKEISFTAGSPSAPAEGATLVQGAVSATVKRVVHETGSWAAGNAAGRFIITTPAGGSFTSGTASIGGTTVTLSGAESQITLQPGGRFQFITENFTGAAETRRLYGCDGVNRAFEFDGEILVPIRTGAIIDQPKHIAGHRNHLMLSILHSVLHSAAGAPYKFNGAEGGGEIATGDLVTNLVGLPGNQNVAALAIFGVRSTTILYGNQKSDFVAIPYKEAIGAYDYTAQSFTNVYIFHDLGLIDFTQTLAFGNFLTNTLTTAIQPYVLQKRSKVAYSVTARSKNQYRLFFTDGSGLYATVLNGRFLGATRVVFPHPVFCAWEGVQNDGEVASYFGSALDGMVYQLDKGSSFDGEPIQAWMELAWYYGRNPRRRKRWRRLGLHIEGKEYAEFQFGYQLGYARPAIPSQPVRTYTSALANPPYWDGFTWDNFYWDGSILVPNEIPLFGTAENIQFRLEQNTDENSPFTVSTLLLTSSDRREVR